MPTIKIEDVDLTKAGTPSAVNFNVVVPGFIAADETKEGGVKYTTEFFNKYPDGIAEYSDRATFRKEVGLVQSITPVFSYATLLEFPLDTYNYVYKTTTGSVLLDGKKGSGVANNDAHGDPGAEESSSYKYFYEYNLSGHQLYFPPVYADNEMTEAERLAIAKSVFNTYKNQTYKDKLYYIDGTATDTAPTEIIGGESKKLGKEYYAELQDPTSTAAEPPKYYYHIKQVKANDEYDRTKAYVVVVALGVDEKDAAAQTAPGNGNQIAEELLNIGYNITFVGVNQSTPEDLYNPSRYEALKDKSAYSFRFIISGFNDSNTYSKLNSVYGCLTDLANSRGDCIALLDIDESNYYTEITVSGKKVHKYKNYVEAVQGAVDGLKAISGNKYTAVFTPAVIYGGLTTAKEYNDNTQLPASFHYLTCFRAAIDKGYSEWYAAAGETRGVSDYSIAGTTVSFGSNVATLLEPRTNANPYGLTKAANVITRFKNTYILWGNRIANALESELTANNFLNVRHLVTTIKQQLYVTCKRFSFDPNSDILWINFCNAIRPTLDFMKANEGIRDYQILKIATDLKATFKARIRIIPIEAVEDFDIEISLEDSFGSTVMGVEESI